MNHHRLYALAIAVATLHGTAGAASFFANEGAWDAAVGAAAIAVENFDGAPSSSTTTSLTYGDVTFSCSGTTYCPGFFGTRNLGNGGSVSVYGATPDTLTFTFDHAITFFGIDTIGVGTVGATDLRLSLSNGSSDIVLAGYAAGGTQFVGVYDAAGFTSVSFTGSQRDDGIDFDRLQSGAATVVPEPANLALMLGGVGLLGASARRRKS